MGETRQRLGKNLRLLRELRGRMGQQELAQSVGVSRRTIARLENEDVADPGLDQALRLAETLEVSVTLLATRSLTTVTLPLPEELAERLRGAQGALLLDRIVALLESE